MRPRGMGRNTGSRTTTKGKYIYYLFGGRFVLGAHCSLYVNLGRKEILRLDQGKIMASAMKPEPTALTISSTVTLATGQRSYLVTSLVRLLRCRFWFGPKLILRIGYVPVNILLIGLICGFAQSRMCSYMTAIRSSRLPSPLLVAQATARG